MELNKLKNELAIQATGMTKAQAHSIGVCIRCKEQPKFYSYYGQKEYGISGMCEYCFDIVMTHPDDTCAICELPVEFHTNGLIGKTHEFTNKPEDMRIEDE